MALSTATVSVVKSWGGDAAYNVMGTIAISASPGTYPTGGYTLSLADPLIKASRLPLMVIVQGLAGYVYVFVPGTTIANGTLKVLTGAAAQSALTEFTAGATPAAVSGDTIKFWAIWAGML